MKDEIVEVKQAVVNTFEGEKLEVQGGAYLSPEAWLRTEGELERLRAKKAELEEKSLLVPSLVIGAAIAGIALGWWLGSDDD
ncbi:MAG: hypothetical protein JNM17_32760 [Archangium sp.]|nr:hypothetical protein [Archangium sp.]